MEFSSLVFPLSLTAFNDEKFGSYGPGQGQSPGKLSWIVLRNTSTLPHEIGHNDPRIMSAMVSPAV